MPSSPVSTPQSPRQSDVSFTSVHTLHSERKYSPPSTAIPAYPSTSTISRDSQASADDRPLTKVSSLGTPLLDSSITRIPKARVFLHKEQRPDRPRPKYQSSQSGHLPKRTLTPTNLSNRHRVLSSREKRCVSDLHDAFQARQLRVERTPTPAPAVWQRRRGVTDFNDDILGSGDDVPYWIQCDEAKNWKPSPECDPCIVESQSNSKWTSSLRHLSNLYKKERKTPCLRGSILEVEPPTLTERLGLCALGSERKHGYRGKMHARNSGRGRLSTRRKGKHGELTRRKSPTDVKYMPDAKAGDAIARDDYVGFLVQTPEERSSRPRRSWLRFLKRIRS